MTLANLLALPKGRAEGGIAVSAVGLPFIVFLMLLPCEMVFAQTPPAFTAVGYLDTVDPSHARLVFHTPSATYIVNTKLAQTHLITPTIARPETGDLVVGMRVKIDGVLNGSVISASDIQVLPYVPPGRAATPHPALVPQRIFRGADTQVTGIAIDGTISSGASIFSRNIKVKSGDQTIAISVPHGSTVDLDGQPISIHDLHAGTTVHVAGQFNPDQSFTASRIDATSN